jgi:N-acetylneuraminic acid mutarotase
MSGRRPDPAHGDTAIETLRDAHVFDPTAWEASDREAPSMVGWKRIADLPASRMAGTALALSPSQLIIVSGDDGGLFSQADVLRDQHPGFPRACLVYDASADTWSVAGDAPTCQLATTIAPWEGGWVMVSGEIRPRVRSSAAWLITSPAGAVGNGAAK